MTLAELCASLAAGAVACKSHREAATWMLASGFLEAPGVSWLVIECARQACVVVLAGAAACVGWVRLFLQTAWRHELLFFCAQAVEKPGKLNLCWLVCVKTSV